MLNIYYLYYLVGIKSMSKNTFHRSSCKTIRGSCSNHEKLGGEWYKPGKLRPDSISPGGTRRYNLDRIVAISG